jgi:hypothetical protein
MINMGNLTVVLDEWNRKKATPSPRPFMESCLPDIAEFDESYIDFLAELPPLFMPIFPNLVISDLVSVQPMTAPSEIIYYLDFVYDPNVKEVSCVNIK